MFAKIGLLSFGGPSAQIALMHRILVEERRWLSEDRFLGALSFCMLLPGPEAMQLATYAGWRLHGVAGGLVAGSLFVVPGAVVIFALAWTYAALGSVPLVGAIFLGIKAAVLAIVLEALLRIARRALTRPEHWAIAAGAFVAIFLLGWPFPLIVLAAGLLGVMLGDAGPSAVAQPDRRFAWQRTLWTAALWLAIWLGPLAMLGAIVGPNDLLSQLGWFFAKLAVVTFGGAYAVLAYMAQEAVVGRDWLTAGQMMDGLGLAETTPGPLILVTEFVGFLAAWRGGGASWAEGLGGALVALWVTFAPCFLWIFVGAPYVEWITAQRRLRGALRAITSAVVGVILNLSLWFALHVLFADVVRRDIGVLTVWTPRLASLDLTSVGIAAACAFLLIGRHWSVPSVLAVAAALGTATTFLLDVAAT